MIHFFHRKLTTLNRVEIIAKNIVGNFELHKTLLPKKHLLPVLKSNAYGHGITQIVKIIKHLDFPYFVVDSYYEALKIHELSDKKVLIIGYNPPENYKHFNFKKTSICVYDLASLDALAKLNQHINIHLKLNTGMNRQGINLAEMPALLQVIKKHEKLHLEGVFSHFADADNVDPSFTEMQERKFSECLDYIEEKGFFPEYIHLGNSAGALKTTDPRINAYRLGIGLYGHNVLSEKDFSFEKLQNLQPALRFTSTLNHVQFLSKGEKVGYSCTFEAPENMKIGIISAGYYECLPRALSNIGFIKTDDAFLPIVGNICMNITCFDLKNSKLKIGDTVAVISEEKKVPNSVGRIAAACKTIPYEILVNINESVRRVVV